MKAEQIRENARLRFMKAGSLRLHGMTYKQIGQNFGVTTARARELVLKFDRDCWHTARWGGLKPTEYLRLKPVEDWLNFLTEEQNDKTCMAVSPTGVQAPETGRQDTVQPGQP